MPEVFVNAGNDAALRSWTAITVIGSGFQPGTAVEIDVSPGPCRGIEQVDAAGEFEWNTDMHPKLGCATTVTAVVHAVDGRQASGQTDVFCL